MTMKVEPRKPVKMPVTWLGLDQIRSDQISRVRVGVRVRVRA